MESVCLDGYFVNGTRQSIFSRFPQINPLIMKDNFFNRMNESVKYDQFFRLKMMTKKIGSHVETIASTLLVIENFKGLVKV